MCAQVGRTHLEVKEPCAPDRGKCQSDGKGAHCEVESEGSTGKALARRTEIA